MELRQLEYFVAVAEEGNFTRAAERVHISQSGVSAQIQQLERELGAPLLDRSGRTATLTPAGAAALGPARSVLASVGEVRRAVDDVNQLVRGRLAVGMVVGCTVTPLFDALAAFHGDHPGVELSLVEDSSDRLVDQVRGGDLDLALIGRSGVAPVGLDELTIVSERLVAVVPADHRLARRTRVRLATVIADPVVCMPTGTGIRTVFDQGCAALGVTPSIALQASAPDAVIDLARRGFGAAILSESMAADLDGSLRAVVIGDIDIPAILALVWAPTTSPARRALVARCAEAFALEAPVTDPAPGRPAIGVGAVGVIDDAAAAAPTTPGVYFFLDGERTVVYIGTAGDLRRRLRSHAARQRARSTPREAWRAAVVADVRWMEQRTEDAAAALEADLIVAFQPVLNASLTADGRWVFVVTDLTDHTHPTDLDTGTASIALALVPGAGSPDVPTVGSGARAYGCFPHLGVGVSSRRGIACSEGYASFCRLVWAAAEPDPDASHPRRIAGRSPPTDVVLPFDPAGAPALHRFLSGTGDGFVDDLLADAAARRPPFMLPALRRDGDAARSFFAHGPRSLRDRRLRHGLAPGPVAADALRDLLAAEIVDAIGEVRLGPPEDPTGGILGARASRAHATRGALRRRR